MRGARKPKTTLHKNKVTAEPAVVLRRNPDHLSRVVDKPSSPSSIQSGYSLYSTETTNAEVNRGLDRCAHLLSNMLEADHETVTGQAPYRYKTSKAKPVSKAHPTRLLAKSASHKRKKPPGYPALISQHQSTKAVGKRSARKEPTAERRNKDVVVHHTIPTGLSITRPRTGKSPSHCIAPGFQNCLMTSTPEVIATPAKQTTHKNAASQKSTAINAAVQRYYASKEAGGSEDFKQSGCPDAEYEDRYDNTGTKHPQRLASKATTSRMRTPNEKSTDTSGLPAVHQGRDFPLDGHCWAPVSHKPDPRGDAASQIPSQDLLRDLVKELTLLNQNCKASTPSTQDIVKGLIQDRVHDSYRGLSNAPEAYPPQQYIPNRDPGRDRSSRRLSNPTPPTNRNRGVNLNSNQPKSPTPPEDQKQCNSGHALPSGVNLTPKKHLAGDMVITHVPTPFIPSRQPANLQVDGENGGDPWNPATSPPRSNKPLAMDPRGSDIKRRSMHQVRALKYLLHELQTALADHCDIEVSRLMGEIDEACNMIPYTTQKYLLDLNTEVHLALQPLQAECSQLRRRLRIANHQLKTREEAEKEHKESTLGSLEVLTLQTLNNNLQKQLHEAELERGKALAFKLETSKTLDERQQQHKDMLEILGEKDTNLLRSQQESWKELQDLRDELDALKSETAYLKLKLEGTCKEMKILGMTLEQRDNEVNRLNALNQVLKDQIRTLSIYHMGGGYDGVTAGGEHRRGGILTERSPNTDYRITSHRQRKLSLENLPPCYPAAYFRATPNNTRRNTEVCQWAETDTLMKDQQRYSEEVTRDTGDNTTPVNHSGDWEGDPPQRVNKFTDENKIEFSPCGGGENHTSNFKLIKCARAGVTTWDAHQQPGEKTQESKFSPRKLSFQCGEETGVRPLTKEYLGIPLEPKFSQCQLSSQHVQDSPGGIESLPQSDATNIFHSLPQLLGTGKQHFKTTASRKNKTNLDEVYLKLETESFISESTTSTVTSQYEAHFQLGLDNLDAEIGKLQASLKCSQSYDT